MMSAKMATPGLLKATVFWNKVYGIIIPVHDITNKILSHDSKKTKAYYCMNCLQYNTVIICLRELKRPSTLQLDHV